MELNPAQIVLLRILSTRPAGADEAELRAGSGMAAETVRGALQALERGGLIARSAGRLSITDAGTGELYAYNTL